MTVLLLSVARLHPTLQLLFMHLRPRWPQLLLSPRVQDSWPRWLPQLQGWLLAQLWATWLAAPSRERSVGAAAAVQNQPKLHTRSPPGLPQPSPAPATLKSNSFWIVPPTTQTSLSVRASTRRSNSASSPTV